ncbi:MAG: GspH/FimT family pseudopilin [Halioglobus sp.]
MTYMKASAPKGIQGFTILELLVAMTIVGMLLTASVPSTIRFYESMQYRKAIRDVVTTLGSARYRAVNSGKAQDVSINPDAKLLAYQEHEVQIPEMLTVAVHSAKEVNTDSTGVIRFYPEGGSSGGGIDLERPDGSGVRIAIDWLAGRVTHEAY